MRLVAWLGGRTFASLRNHRNFRLYFVSHGVSFAGTWMQQIAGGSRCGRPARRPPGVGGTSKSIPGSLREAR